MEVSMVDKIDVKRTLDGYQAKRGHVRVLEVPDTRYLMLDGRGDPNTSPAFAAAVQALYPVAYAMKFASKTDLGRDYVVPPLEGLWWAEDLSAFTAARDKSRWNWTLMLLVPDWLGEDAVGAAKERVAATSSPERLDDVRVGTLSEGRCVQTLHVGTFDSEAEVLASLHDEFIPGNGFRMTGKHHEIYLSDLRRVAPEKQRTILRQPVVERS
jgi:hypothetical protein